MNWSDKEKSAASGIATKAKSVRFSVEEGKDGEAKAEITRCISKNTGAVKGILKNKMARDETRDKSATENKAALSKGKWVSSFQLFELLRRNLFNDMPYSICISTLLV